MMNGRDTNTVRGNEERNLPHWIVVFGALFTYLMYR